MLYRNSDNVLIYEGDGYNDYLAICFKEMEQRFPYMVSLARYSVPGRYETYVFDYSPAPSSGIGDRVCYFTDTGTTMLDALKMLNTDLNKKHVVDMILSFCEKRRHHGFARMLSTNLLAYVSPKSKTQKVLKKLLASSQR